MRIGQAQIDFEALLIESSAGRFPTEPKVMAVLAVLVENANKPVTREALIEAVWGVDYGGDERLSRAISILRKALGDTRGNHSHIETIPRRGYRLIADIETGDVPQSIAFVPGTEGNELEEEKQDSSALGQTEDIKATGIKTEDEPVVESQFSPAPQFEGGASAPAKRPAKIFGFGAIAAVAVVAVIALVMWLGPIGGTITEIPQKRRVETGLEHIKHFARKDAIAEAQVLFAGMLADDPDHAAARAGMAMALMREYTHLERDPALLRRAKSLAEAALRSDPNLALANIAVGWAAEYEGDFEKAHKSYDRADILDPDNIFSLEGRARAYNRQGKRTDAKKIVELAISKYPNYPLFFSYAGRLLLSDNDYNGAEKMFRQVINLSSDNARAYSLLAQALHLQDRTDEAINVLQDGLEINKAAQLYNNLGTYLFFQGQYEMSAEAFERTLDFDGNTHRYLYWANLADAYRQVPEHKPDANSAYDRALQLLQAELDNLPDDARLNSRAALYSAKRGYLDQARTALSRVPFDASVSANEYYRAVITHEILAERSEALIMLKRAIEAGYPLTEILNDPELADLRQDPNYHRLLITQSVKKETQL